MNFATELEYPSSIKWYIYRGNVFSRSHHQEVTATLAFIAEKQKSSGILRERESMNIVFYIEKLATLPAHLHWTYYYCLC